MRCFSVTRLLLPVIVLALASPPAHAGQIFSGSGAAATTAFNSFRTATGGAAGSRIGWDGVRLDGTDVNPNTQVIDSGKTVAIPIDRFRGAGAIFGDPYAVSGEGFASLNPDTAGAFPAFSPNNTFAMFDTVDGQFEDRLIEQSFVLPGTSTVAGTRGFGAIFLDVELAGTSSIEYFGKGAGGRRVSLGKFDVPVGQNGEPQFLGVVFNNPVIAEVVLTVGTHALFSFDGTNLSSFGPEDLTRQIDLAVTDDFVFARPETLQAVPEPASFTLIVAGACVVAAWRVRRTASRVQS